MILVTGATGFVGSYILLELIAKNIPVTGTYYNENSISKTKAIFDFYKKTDDFKKIIWHKVDLTNYYGVYLSLENIDTVIHCAALVTFSNKNKKKLISYNTTLTENIVNASIERQIKTFCHVSSIAVYSNPINGIISESTNRNPSSKASAYAISKYKSELIVERAFAENLNGFIVHPSVIWGFNPSKKDLLRFLTNYISKGYAYSPQGNISLVHAKSLAEMLVVLINNYETGDKYIINSEDINYSELLLKIVVSLGKKKNIKTLSKEKIYFLGKLFHYLPYLNQVLNKDIAKIINSKFYYRNDKVVEKTQVKINEKELWDNLIHYYANKS